MKTIEMTGKTVDEALKNALNELKLTKEEVDIEIIDEGSKGIFNLIGNKPARIKITKKKSAIDEVEKFLTDVYLEFLKNGILIEEKHEHYRMQYNSLASFLAVRLYIFNFIRSCTRYKITL